MQKQMFLAETPPQYVNIDHDNCLRTSYMAFNFIYQFYMHTLYRIVI